MLRTRSRCPIERASLWQQEEAPRKLLTVVLPNLRRCIPVRINGTGAEGVEVLLISSRGGKGFCFPKVRESLLPAVACMCLRPQRSILGLQSLLWGPAASYLLSEQPSTCGLEPLPRCAGRMGGR